MCTINANSFWFLFPLFSRFFLSLTFDSVSLTIVLIACNILRVFTRFRVSKIDILCGFLQFVDIDYYICFV